MLDTPGPEIVVQLPGGPASAGPATVTSAVAAAAARTRDERRMGAPGRRGCPGSLSVLARRGQTLDPRGRLGTVDPMHRQLEHRVRFDWGPTGAAAIASGADVAVVVDV